MNNSGQAYEIIGYNKNFITGDKVERKKQKNYRGIKGKVLVEVYDAKDNEKIEEAYTENLIPDLYFKDIFLSQFVQGIMGAGKSRQSENYSWFNYIYLTDNDKPENINDQRILGNIIGFAHRNEGYSGNDTKRGTVNITESKFEVTDSKIKMNFVFDFPTHAANGKIESIYWGESSPDNKDCFYLGATVYGRENADLNCSIQASSNPKRYWGIYNLFKEATAVKFTGITKGWILLDAKNTNITQSNYIKFPDNLKGHWIVVPFDINMDEVVIWNKAVKLLNSAGEALIIDSSHEIKRYDGLSEVCPFIESDGGVSFIGYFLYDIGSEKFIRIYKWSKVGVQLSYVDINMNQTFKDADYNIPFTCGVVSADGVYTDGCIDIVGYTERRDNQFNEMAYTSRWIRINSLGAKIQDTNIKPKLGNCSWFNKNGMDSGNIERRACVVSFKRSSNKIYFNYYGIQGGKNFYQVLTPQGNLLEAYKMSFDYSSTSIDTRYYNSYNILGTDRWISRYMRDYGSYVESYIQTLLTSRPIGAHTKLTQAVEKTEANTMKVQYMFEVDLISYGEDTY